MIYNLIEYSDSYYKTSGSLWQYFKDETTFKNFSPVSPSTANCRSTESFKFKNKFTGNITAVETAKDAIGFF